MVKVYKGNIIVISSGWLKHKEMSIVGRMIVVEQYIPMMYTHSDGRNLTVIGKKLLMME